jgi:ankyrin repeat protein
MYNQLSQHQKNLLSAITDKKSLTTIKQLSENTKALSKHILNISIKNPEALEFFLTENSNPNEQNEFNKSLLMYAAQYNELESAKILIKNKADLNLSTIIPNDTCTYKLSKFGMTALHYAVRYASYDFVKLLLDNGAYPYAKTSEQDGGYPIDWLKKYTATAAQERNPNITQEQILALEALLKLPTPEEIAKKVLSYNLTAEQEFSKGNIESAYMNCKYALGLDEHNERALANFSLITLKMNKKLESLEASYNLINFGKDINQVANAWFNYGLTCGSGKFSYENYNGVLHCEKLPIYYFLNSFNKKPSSSRANKIVESLKKGETPNCQFKKGNINLLITLSTYGSEKDLYVLTPKSSSLDVSKIVWYNQHETKDANNLITKTRIKKSPEKLVNTYDLGDFTMNIYQSDKAIDTPIEFDGETCNRRLFGAYTVSPSTEK